MTTPLQAGPVTITADPAHAPGASIPSSPVALSGVMHGDNGRQIALADPAAPQTTATEPEPLPIPGAQQPAADQTPRAERLVDHLNTAADVLAAAGAVVAAVATFVTAGRTLYNALKGKPNK